MVTPETFESTTVYFGGVVGFKDAVMNASSPWDLVAMLNQLYSVFDDIIGNYDVYKVEVVVDDYLVYSTSYNNIFFILNKCVCLF
jgi:atrial natriuretic peptide receptor A